VRPLKRAKGGFEYIYVVIDKFTKWIEYKPLVKYSAAKAVEFIQDIMHRFGMPNRVIMTWAPRLRPSSLRVGSRIAA
jgi:hypothetical protein